MEIINTYRKKGFRNWGFDYKIGELSKIKYPMVLQLPN